MKYLKTFLPALVIATLISCNAHNNQSNAVSDSSTREVPTGISTTDTTGKLMKEADFWKIIASSIEASGNNYDAQITSLKNILAELEPADIVKFDNEFNALLAASYDYKLWGASYVINGGCSDDCFEYFRGYLIAHGQDKFYATLKDPESCVCWIKSEVEDDWEGIRYAASDAFKQVTGKDIPENYHVKYEIKGQPFNEATIDKEYPILAKKFSGRPKEEE